MTLPESACFGHTDSQLISGPCNHQPSASLRPPAPADMLADDRGVPKDQVKSWSGYPGGAPCNVACGLGLLGIPVALVSCLGKDDKGDELMQLMQGMRLRTLAAVMEQWIRSSKQAGCVLY
jgi:pfkB family carbohydrate kinase